MATSPLGGFADLSSARRRVDAAIANNPGLLGSFSQGVQQGVALENLPQAIEQQKQEQALQLLERQLKAQIAQQTLQNIQTEAPIKQALQRALLQQKGIFYTPQIAGQPATLPAIPLDVSAIQAINSSPDNAPLAAEATRIGGDGPLPQVLGPGAVLDPLTQQANLNNILQREISKKQLESDVILDRQKALADYTKKTAATAGKQEFVRSLTDPKDVRLVRIGEGEGPPPGYQFVKSALDGEEAKLKPSEIITAQREIRNTYQEMPSKRSLFGNGQIPGSYELKRRLDALLKPGLDAQGNPQFKKLNAQAKSVFINAMNNLKDPTSATLTTEAAQIASKMGILDRMGTYVDSIKTGDDVSEAVAADIYEVLTQVYDQGKEEFLENIAPQVANLELIGKNLEDIGVPVAFAKEARARLKAQSEPSVVVSPVGTPGINPNTPSPIQDPLGLFP